MSRFHQILLLATFVPWCWLAMMAVHELGHVVGALLTGGQVRAVVLHPLTISRTDVAPNPHPGLVAASGPVVGILLPLLIWLVMDRCRWGMSYLAGFFAGFCLIANGAYLALGSLGRVEDAGDLMQSAVPAWSLWLFGLMTIAAGLMISHGLGPGFGLGKARGEVDHKAVYVSSALLVVTVVLQLLLSAR